MSFRGRSPFKDVVRSVVMSAAMVSPTLLAACAESPPVVPQTPPDPTATKEVPSVQVATSDDGGAVPAPDDSVVRPRTPPGLPPQMPTRGFSGAARRARA